MKVKNKTHHGGIPQWSVAKTVFPMPADPGSIPDQGTRVHMLQLKLPCAPNKDQEQPYIYIYIYVKRKPTTWMDLQGIMQSEISQA